MATDTTEPIDGQELRYELAHEGVTLRSVAVVLLEGDAKQRVHVWRLTQIDPDATPHVVSDRCFIEISEDAYQALLLPENATRIQ